MLLCTGSAKAGTDFVTTSTTHTVNAGFIGGQRCLEIKLLSEEGLEADKSFFVQLTIVPNNDIRLANDRTEVIIYDGIKFCFYFHFLYDYSF